MSKSTYLAAAGTAFVLAASVSTVALAWHPQDKITKEVQNVTTGGTYADADTASSAVVAHPGDTLRYRITVSNPAQPAENQDNDLVKVDVKDAVPAGVTLTSGAVKDKNFGDTVVVPQNSAKGNKAVSYDFTVTVDQNDTDGQLICNIAAFTGKSVNGDTQVNGQDQACVKVVVPPTPVTPTTPVTPSTPTPVTTLPSTGANPLVSVISAIALSGLAFGTTRLLQRR